jgi:hypothetical protein
VGELEAVHTFEFGSMHCFSPDAPQWIAEEALYASDTCVEDYYTRSHVKNRGMHDSMKVSMGLFGHSKLTTKHKAKPPSLVLCSSMSHI